MLEMQSMKLISSNKIQTKMAKILLFLMDFGAAHIWQKIMLNKQKLTKILKNLILDLITVKVKLFFCINS